MNKAPFLVVRFTALSVRQVLGPSFAGWPFSLDICDAFDNSVVSCGQFMNRALYVPESVTARKGSLSSWIEVIVDP